MVAYNLMLAVFPFALLVLFVFGQVLKIGGVETSVAQRPPAALPQRRAADADRRPQPDRGQLDDDRDRRLPRLALDRRLLLGRDGHRLLPHLPRRVPRLGRAEALLLRDARRRPALHRRQHLPADDREQRSSPAPTGCPSASPTSRRSTRSLLLGAALLVTFVICCVIFWAVPKGHMPWRAVWPGAALRHRRRRPRQLALPDLPLQRLQPLPLRLDPRLHPHRPALVLRAQPGAAGRRGDQLAAPRAPRHRRDALRQQAALPGLRRLGPAPSRRRPPVAIKTVIFDARRDLTRSTSVLQTVGTRQTLKNHFDAKTAGF